MMLPGQGLPYLEMEYVEGKRIDAYCDEHRLSPGSTGTVATSINDDGAITGTYGDSGGSHGFVRSPEGMITSFDLPNEQTHCLRTAGPVLPTSINQEGVIIGRCFSDVPDPSIIGWIRYP